MVRPLAKVPSSIPSKVDSCEKSIVNALKVMAFLRVLRFLPQGMLTGWDHGRTGRGNGGGGAVAPPICWPNKASRAISASKSGK